MKKRYSKRIEQILNAIEESESFVFECAVKVENALEEIMKATKQQQGLFRSTFTKLTMSSAQRLSVSKGFEDGTPEDLSLIFTEQKFHLVSPLIHKRFEYIELEKVVDTSEFP